MYVLRAYKRSPRATKDLGTCITDKIAAGSEVRTAPKKKTRTCNTTVYTGRRLAIYSVYGLFSLSAFSALYMRGNTSRDASPENSPSLMVYSPLHCSAPVGGQNPCIALINWEKRELDISRSGLTQAILLHVHVDIYWTYNSARKKITRYRMKSIQHPYFLLNLTFQPLQTNKKEKYN